MKRKESTTFLSPKPARETSGRLQNQTSAIHGLTVKSDKSDWLKIQSEYSVHAQRSLRFRSLGWSKWSAGSGDKNENTSEKIFMGNLGPGLASRLHISRGQFSTPALSFARRSGNNRNLVGT